MRTRYPADRTLLHDLLDSAVSPLRDQEMALSTILILVRKRVRREGVHRFENQHIALITVARRVFVRYPDWDTIATRERLTSRDLTTEPRDLFDSILEPLPPGVERFRSSLSEELYRCASWGADVDVLRFGSHRDTFALLGLSRVRSRWEALPAGFFEKLLFYIDFGTYLAIRLTCRCWSEAVTRVCPIGSPPG